jgi:hypothetical protein
MRSCSPRSICIESMLHRSIERKSQNRTWNLRFCWNLGSARIPCLHAYEKILGAKKGNAEACDILLYVKPVDWSIALNLSKNLVASSAACSFVKFLLPLQLGCWWAQIFFHTRVLRRSHNTRTIHLNLKKTTGLNVKG